MSKIILLAPCLLALAGRVLADDTPNYPTWVTNDYGCVIKCMEDQFKDAKPPATSDKTEAALGCVRDACSKDTAEGNIYQAHYIINMFNSIGSIYEPEAWQKGNAPNAQDLKAPDGWTQTEVTTTWTESDKPTTVTTSVWVPPKTQEAAVQAAEPSPSSKSTPSAHSQATSVAVATASGSKASNGTSTATHNATRSGAAGREIVSLNVGVSLLLGLGAMLVGGVAGGVGLVGM